MSLRRLFVPAATLAADDVVVEDEGHHHLARVLRVVRDERVILFDGEGNEAEAHVRAVERTSTRLEVVARRRRPIVRGAALTLCQGLIRPEKMDWVVQKATELGVARIVPTLCERSQGHARGRNERWTRIAREAARQCGRADVPDVEEVVPWSEALRAGPADAQRVVLWEELGEREPLGRVLKALPPAVVLAVGPEGGLGEKEIAGAREAGFVTAGLGPRVLRAETAAIVALALAQQATGGLG